MSPGSRPLPIAALLAGLVLTAGGGYLAWVWLFCRVYVEPGRMLVLHARLGEENPDPAINTVVDDGYKGIRRQVLGEGRYFFDPVSFERMTEYPVTDIGPSQVGVLRAEFGTQLATGEFLAGEGQRGIMREVLTPGRYRINPFAHAVTVHEATVIPAGWVGCVITQSGAEPTPGRLAGPGERGIQQVVLQPGIYYLNPHAMKVVKVEIGYREEGFEEVEFPSRDGFRVRLGTSVVWGISPSNVPTIVGRFGTVADVVEKAIRPQVESMCRMQGSKYGARELIEGATREQFQDSFKRELVKSCQDKSLDVLLALIRTIEVPSDVRLPIQQAKIAAEEGLTKAQERVTQDIFNQLEEIKQDVRKGEREVDAGTERLIASIQAEARRTAAGIRAKAAVAVSEMARQVAELEAQRQRLLGEADAKVKELKRVAEADRVRRLVEALGDPAAYATYVFVKNLSRELQLSLRYAGHGTLWTDLTTDERRLQGLAATKLLEEGRPAAMPSTSGPPPGSKP